MAVKMGYRQLMQRIDYLLAQIHYISENADSEVDRVNTHRLFDSANLELLYIKAFREESSAGMLSRKYEPRRDLTELLRVAGHKLAELEADKRNT